MRVRVVLADDQAVVRAGFRALLDLTDDLVVVGEAVDGDEAVRVTRAARPDVVLMDVRMPARDGIAATAAITGDPALAATRVVVLTTFALDEYVLGALAAGASGFLLKDAEPEAVYDAVRRVAAGEAVLDPAVTAAVIAELGRRSPPARDPERLAVLTDKERAVLARVAAGRTNAEIGADLVMSPLTAKTHVSRIMGKLGARDRVHLVVIAHETGLA
ncbi:MAG TPA: response regulator transcription factor [Iamia sp.]|nr:response regulator transcription factor [Iamia sp.]